MDNFVRLFSCIIGALEKISEWKDATATGANIVLKTINSEFVVSLQVIKVIIN